MEKRSTLSRGLVLPAKDRWILKGIYAGDNRNRFRKQEMIYAKLDGSGMNSAYQQNLSPSSLPEDFVTTFEVGKGPPPLTVEKPIPFRIWSSNGKHYIEFE